MSHLRTSHRLSKYGAQAMPDELHNTDAVYDQLEKLIAGHGAVHWRREGGRITIRRAPQASGPALYCVFAYDVLGHLYYHSEPTPRLRHAFAAMPSTPARVFTATHYARPGTGQQRKRGTPHGNTQAA